MTDAREPKRLRFWWAALLYWVVPTVTLVINDDKLVLTLQISVAAYVTFLSGHYHAEHLRRRLDRDTGEADGSGQGRLAGRESLRSLGAEKRVTDRDQLEAATSAAKWVTLAGPDSTATLTQGTIKQRLVGDGCLQSPLRNVRMDAVRVGTHSGRGATAG